MLELVDLLLQNLFVLGSPFLNFLLKILGFELQVSCLHIQLLFRFSCLLAQVRLEQPPGTCRAQPNSQDETKESAHLRYFD